MPSKPAKTALPYAPGPDPVPYSVGLRFTAPGSDKVYRLSIEPSGEGWVVNYANGPYGGTIKSNTKTSTPVSYDEALKVCTSKLNEQVGKGYLPTEGSMLGEGGVAMAVARVEARASGFVPHLLGEMADEDLERYLTDDAYGLQEKHDGERRPAMVVGGVASGGNKKGQAVPLTPVVEAALLGLKRDVKLDTEAVGDVLYVFDVTSVTREDGKETRDVSAMPFAHRVRICESLGLDGDVLRPVPVAVGTEAKRALLERVREVVGEGVVFKRLDAPYVPGASRDSSQVKFKFWKTLSAVVTGHNAKRSVSMGLHDGDGVLRPCGNVTVPGNRAVPAVGTVIEVRYMPSGPGTMLQQPQLKGPRADVDPSECLASQRIDKRTPEPEDVPAPAP